MAMAGDLDGDGDLDVVATAAHAPSRPDVALAWFENTGKDTWVMHPLKSNWPNAGPVIVADLDGDGRPDIVPARWTDRMKCVGGATTGRPARASSVYTDTFCSRGRRPRWLSHDRPQRGRRQSFASIKTETGLMLIRLWPRADIYPDPMDAHAIRRAGIVGEQNLPVAKRANRRMAKAPFEHV
ncbi:MAG: VCBS repeat-containing protein [Opitutaceae bacterium]|nr:VCBS repeat-containing protein [Opitutaceae bacterium]